MSPNLVRLLAVALRDSCRDELEADAFRQQPPHVGTNVFTAEVSPRVEVHYDELSVDDLATDSRLVGAK